MTERRHVDQITGEIIDDPEIRPFAAFLTERPKTHDEMSESLWDLVARVVDTGKKGSLTLTITVEPAKDAPGVLMVSDEIKLKLPSTPGRPASTGRTGKGISAAMTRASPNLTGSAHSLSHRTRP